MTKISPYLLLVTVLLKFVNMDFFLSIGSKCDNNTPLNLDVLLNFLKIVTLVAKYN